MDATYEADVVICGGGIAGISTAIEALDRGKSVLVLDRDAEPALGGLALESAGGVFVVDTPEQRKRGIKDTPEKALTDWLDFAEFGPDDRWPRAWAEAYVGGCRAEVYDWVKGFGVEFLPVPQWPERGLYGEGNSVPRWHLAWGMGKGLTEPLVARLRNHPNAAKLTLRFGHRVEGLETRAGVVAGVHGILERGEASFAAKGQAIVIASGGIGGNLQRVKRHWHPEWGTPPEILLNGAHRYGDGRLHDAAESAGARLTHMNRMWAYVGGIHHPKPRWPDHGL
ncbi:MAG: FAD-dependent oxidoreductase, partial [Alphaproteobacteria bacterium]|nr:FAD-dependent oxidoreductase [Alphaproteobacteria bacterium]